MNYYEYLNIISMIWRKNENYILKMSFDTIKKRIYLYQHQFS